MRFAVLGTGQVGQAIAAGLHKHGHDVTMGTRDPASGKLDDWLAEHLGIEIATFADAAAGCQAAVLCTNWAGAENALRLADPQNLAEKLVIDVTNPLKADGQGPPGLAVSGDDSAGETVQRLLPNSGVVKCWNIINNSSMIDPDLPEPPTMFIAGDDGAAKEDVLALLEQVGWTDVVDLGGIQASRYIEGLAMVWILTYFATGKGDHAFRLVRS